MKRKLSKILGVGLAVGLVASLIVTALPAAAGTLAYETIATPSNTGDVLQEGTDIDVIAVAPDGVTMFAYDNVNGDLYKSTNAGVSFTTTAIGGTTLEAETDVVAIAVSPTYATDSTVVIATPDTVYRSSNGGVSFGAVSTALLLTATGADGADTFITSVDVATYYTGGALAIVIGTKDTTADQGGGVWICRLDTWTWDDQEVGDVAGGDGDDAAAADVYAVAFSPNHLSDAQILAVVTGTTGAGDYAADTTHLATKFAASAWASDILDGGIGTAITEAEISAAGHAVMAFADDYEWSSNNSVLVGLSNADEEDLYRVVGGQPGGATTVYDLGVGGASTDTEVFSIAVDGDIVGATVLVGIQGSTTVKRTADPTTSTVTWSSSVKSPVGDGTNPDTIVFKAGDNYYAATDGTNSCLSVSTDGGILFNGLSLMDVTDISDINIGGFHIVDADTMFLLLHNDPDAGGDFDANETQMVFKTTDGGTTWERILHNVSAGAADGMAVLAVSPEYATDDTIWVAHATASSRIWKSTDGGGRFIGLAAPANITAFTAIDGSNYFTGHAAGLVYKNGLWNYGTAADTIQSITLAPDFATSDTVFVGNNDGDVYYSTNASASASVLYTLLGVAEELGDGATIVVAADPSFADNATIYAGSSTATEGVNRWVIGTSLVWTQLDDDTNSLIANGLITTPDGALYAASGTADKGIRREVNPTWATGYLAFESFTTLLAAGGKVTALQHLSGSTNTLYATISDITTPSTAYEHDWALLAIDDTLAISPTLTGPDDGVTGTSTTVTFTWDAVTVGSTAATYDFEIGTDADFASKLVDTTTGGTSYTASTMSAGTKYWWRVFVSSGAPFATRGYYQIRSFTTALGTASQDADVSAPRPGATGVSTTPLFQWGAIGGSTSYTVEVADNADFTDATSTSVDTNTMIWSGTLENDTTYWWRVKGVGASTESAWSTGAFTTEAEAVEAAAAPATTVTVAAPPAPQVTVEAPPAAIAPSVTVEAPAAPSVTVEAPPAPSVTVQAPPAPSVTVEAAGPTATPGYVWAIIVIGAVLTIAVIVLIVRTRRVV